MLTTTLHLTLTLTVLYSTFLIFLLENPVHVVLLLVLIFSTSGFTLLMFNVEFIGLVFIMIYVGAIAVLFLFVIMMICTKKIAEKKKSFFFYLIFFFLIHSLIYTTFKLINDAFLNDLHPYIFEIEYKNYFIGFDFFNSTEVLGLALFNYYHVAVLIAGLILLIALIGAIALTINFKKEKFNKDKNLTKGFEIKYFK
jgi:NADH-quinone oxidoreductase subunit J